MATILEVIKAASDKLQAQLDALKNDTERSNQAILSDEIAAYAAREAEARKFGQDTAALESQRLALVAEAARAAGGVTPSPSSP